MDELKLFEALLKSPPVAACVLSLAAAVFFLFRLLLKRTDESSRRLSELEKEFREYIADAGAKTGALLERATKVLEDISRKI